MYVGNSTGWSSARALVNSDFRRVKIDCDANEAVFLAIPIAPT